MANEVGGKRSAAPVEDGGVRRDVEERSEGRAVITLEGDEVAVLVLDTSPDVAVAVEAVDEHLLEGAGGGLHVGVCPAGALDHAALSVCGEFGLDMGILKGEFEIRRGGVRVNARHGDV